MNAEKFKPYFEEGWFLKFKDFLESKEMDEIINDLKSRTQRGKIIFPHSSTLKKRCPSWESENTTYRCFKETPYDKLKVIFVGLSPYFTIMDNKPVADGLAFSTKSKYCPPSLSVLYDAIEDDVYQGLDLNMKRNNDLTYLAQQGVLLLNASLTCEPSLPTIHMNLWQPFIKYFFLEIINKYFTGLHIVFFGEEARKYRKIINQRKENEFIFENFHYIYEVEHPAFHARNLTKLKTNVFSTINKRLMESNGENIIWDIKTK